MKKCTVIYNPHSGRRLNLDLERFNSILKSYGYTTEFKLSKYKGYVSEEVQRIDYTDLVISIGGDGTFNEIMSGNLKRDKKLLVSHLPVGTTNDIGNMFGYEKDIYKNLELLLDESLTKILLLTKKITMELFLLI